MNQIAKSNISTRAQELLSFQSVTVKSVIKTLLPIVALVILMIYFTIVNPAFLSAMNLLNILRQLSILLIVALGSTFIISMGSIDLSFGSVVTLSAALCSYCLVDLETTVLTGVLMGTLVGVLCGLVNGTIFAFLRVPSFLVTLGTMFALDGISLMILDGTPKPVYNDVFLQLTRGSLIGSIPNIFLWAIVIYLVAVFVSFRTRFGRYMFAIGGGELVAKMSGVPVAKFKLYSFLVAGLLSGFAGVLMASRVGAGTPRMGEGLLMDGIAAVVIGGTALTGGIGGAHKTILGVLLIAVLSNGMNILSVDPYLQIVIKGVVVILGVAISIDRSKILINK